MKMHTANSQNSLRDNIEITTDSFSVDKKALKIRKVGTTLLLPAVLFDKLNERLISHGVDLENYIKILLVTFSSDFHEGNLIPQNSLTTVYQIQQQNLVPIFTRISADVWQSLRILARGLGISMCLLFTRLLLLDLTSKPGKIICKVKQIHHGTRIYYNLNMELRQYYYYEVCLPPPTKRIRGMICTEKTIN